MRKTRLTRWLLPAILIPLAGLACQSHPRRIARPATQPVGELAGQGIATVSNLRVQTAAASTYVFQSTRTTYGQIGAAVGRALPALDRAVGRTPGNAHGPLLLIYHGATEDSTRPFDLDIGYTVPTAPPAPADIKVRQLPAFRCASVIYTGPLRSISHAYDQLIPAMLASRLAPNDETREVYLLWQGELSPENVILVQVGIR